MTVDAIVLAGGPGMRLRAVVPELPKPMAPVGGRPFLEHLLGYWQRQGVKRCVLAVGYKHERIREHFQNRFGSMDIDYSVEETLLGTGGGLLKAFSMTPPRETLLVLNADTYFEVNLESLRRFHEANRSDLTLAAYRPDRNDRYGAVRTEQDGKVTGFTTRLVPGQVSGLINGGVYLTQPEVWSDFRVPEASQKLSLEEDLLPALLRRGKRIYALAVEGRFVDIGVPKDYEAAAQIVPIDGQNR